MEASRRRLGSFGGEILRLREGRADVRTGLLGAAFVLAPLGVGLAIGQTTGAVLSSLGTLNLFLADAPIGQTRTRVSVLAAVVGAFAVAFGVGSAVALLPGPIETVLIAVGLTAALYTAMRVGAAGPGLLVAVLFIIPLGLPPTTDLNVAVRALCVLAGGLWGLAGAFLLRSVPALATRPEGPVHDPVPIAGSHQLGYAAAVGATAAVGFLAAHELGLLRDFWVMLTVLVALRPDLAGTFAYATMRIVGTVAGAGLAYFLTVSTTSLPLLAAALALATAVALAIRSMNYILYATAITVVVIGLLNLAYSGGPALAVVRIEDTILGGALAVLTGAFLTFGLRAHRRPGGSSGG